MLAPVKVMQNADGAEEGTHRPRQWKRRTLEGPRTHVTHACFTHTTHTKLGRHVLQEFKHCATTKASSMQLHALRRAHQTGESIGARSPCECFPEQLRFAARKAISPYLCGIRESFERHILPRFSLSRERNEAYYLLDLQRPASDWAIY